MNFKELQLLKEGMMVICKRTAFNFTRGKIYSIGGGYWPEVKRKIKSIKTEKDLPFANLIAVQKNDVNEDDAWHYSFFEIVDNQEVAKILYGNKSK